MHYIRSFQDSGSVQNALNNETYKNVYVARLLDTDTYDYNDLRPQYPGVASIDGAGATPEEVNRVVDGTIADLDLV